MGPKSFFILMIALLVKPIFACQPYADQRTFVQRLSASAFLGRVSAVTPAEWQKPGAVTFVVLTSNGEPAIGKTVTYPYRDYGTCGKFTFNVGEVWLYSDDTPLGGTLKPTAADRGSDGGKDFAALIDRIGHRIGPK